MNAEKGIVFNIQRYCVHDGPGIRTTVFLKGCPLRCAWCSNPESHQLLPETGYNKSKCLGCHRCIQVCPLKALSVAEDGSIKKNRELCKPELCSEPGKEPPCTLHCPPKAMILYGHQMLSTEVVDQVEKDSIFYRDGGGITLSGGEPLMQEKFALAILSDAHERGIHTAVETTGCVGRHTLEKICPYLDYINMDLKSLNNETHKKYTGVSVEPILNNLKWLCETFPDIPIRIRTPVIPNVNDTAADIMAIVNYIEPLTNTTYELLPYHSMGAQKYTYLGREYTMGESRLSEGTVEHLRDYAKQVLRDRVVSQG